MHWPHRPCGMPTVQTLCKVQVETRVLLELRMEMSRGWPPCWLRWESVHLQCGRPGFNPWVRKISWRRKWQPTAIFFPGESHGQRNLVGYSLCSHKESDTTEQLHFSMSRWKRKEKQKHKLIAKPIQEAESSWEMRGEVQENRKQPWEGDPILHWIQERLREGGEGSGREWGGLTASLTQRTWIWAKSGREWRTEEPGELQFMGCQRTGQDLVTERQEVINWEIIFNFSFCLSCGALHHDGKQLRKRNTHAGYHQTSNAKLSNCHLP